MQCEKKNVHNGCAHKLQGNHPITGDCVFCQHLSTDHDVSREKMPICEYCENLTHPTMN
jgi:hypothetical protein